MDMTDMCDMHGHYSAWRWRDMHVWSAWRLHGHYSAWRWRDMHVWSAWRWMDMHDMHVWSA